MENIEELKIMWRDLNQRITQLENENRQLVENIKKKDYKTTQDKLIKKYVAFIGVEIIMIFFMSFFFIFNPYVNEKYRVTALIYWDIFFILELLFDSYLLVQIKKLDIFHSSIKKVARRAGFNWKLHKIGILIGLPLAFGAILLFAFAVDANEFTIMGMILGGIIGLLIGISQLLKFKNYYKLLQVED